MKTKIRITSVKYKVLMNEEPRGNIVPGIGSCQGDPLYPFIFILCTEALVSLLNQAENQGKITGRESHALAPRYLTFSLLMIAFSSVRRSPVYVKKL